LPPAEQSEQLGGARVLCIGDVLLEYTARGARLDGRGAEPVLIVESEAREVGGAAAVLRDLVALGVRVTFVSAVGNDNAGREIEQLMEEEKDADIHLLVQPGRATATRSRFVSGERVLLRADHDNAAPLGPFVREDLLRLARELVTNHGAAVVSDHGKGVLTEGVALEIIRAAREAGAKIVVAAEGGDPIRYRGAHLLTVTRPELAHAAGMPVDGTAAVTAAAGALIDRCAFDGLLVFGPGARVILFEGGGAVTRVRALGTNGIAMIAAGLAAGLPPPAALRRAASE
jgi:D-beta-D-heptose 7-phosphate kinase / D-beta-D-heptose 1-phosphate adenosyltransferase